MSLFEKFLLQAISAQRVLTLLSGMKRSPSPRPSPQGEGESCRRLGNAHCWEGPRVAVPVIRDGNMPSLPQGAVEMSSLPMNLVAADVSPRILPGRAAA